MCSTCLQHCKTVYTKVYCDGHIVLYNSVLCCKQYFSSSSAVLRPFSALYMYSKFGHHPHPWATFVPTSVSVAASVAELAHGEKLQTQSLTNSPSLFDALGTEAFASENTTNY